MKTSQNLSLQQQQDAATTSIRRGSSVASAANVKDNKLPLRRLSQIHVNKTGTDSEVTNEAEMISITSKGSDSRRAMQPSATTSCSTSDLYADDWLVVLGAAAILTLVAFAVLCGLLHGDGKRELTEYRIYNMSLLLTGCTCMTLQLLMACVYMFQGWTGV